MSSNLSSNLKTVIDLFTPEILGAFWITNEGLSRDLVGFDEFNYLFDGLISQYLYGQRVEGENDHKRSNIFFTDNFGQKIFLAHVRDDNETASVLDEQISLVQENQGERKKILVLNRASRNWTQDLKKRYPKFEFLALEL
ncbi:MAG: hypothetical protein ACXVLQ_13710 [Bacteriovorax sp.]